MKKEIEYQVADAIMGRPHGFSVGNRYFYLYPLTLGKMYLLQRVVESMEINQENLSSNIAFEALRLASEKREECLRYIVYNTFKEKDEHFDEKEILVRTDYLGKKLSESDIAELIIMLLTQDKTQQFFKHLGIDKEQQRLSDVMKAKSKNDKNNYSFGGLSVFGTLIDSACERYGWSKEYVVWGIDYASLRLMLADKVVSVYISDEERKKIPASLLSGSQDSIKGTKENMAKIKAMDWK